MLYKGRRYSLCHNVVMLPILDDDGNLQPYVNPSMQNYVYFGRTYTDRRRTASMVKTRYKWGQEEGAEHVYAEPIPIKYFSLTNLALCVDNYFYLLYNGRVYRAKKTPLV
jgi:hypothetical protein